MSLCRCASTPFPAVVLRIVREVGGRRFSCLVGVCVGERVRVCVCVDERVGKGGLVDERAGEGEVGGRRFSCLVGVCGLGLGGVRGVWVWMRGWMRGGVRVG